MGWEKTDSRKVDGTVLFTYSDKSLCKECSSYGKCSRYKDNGACDILEIWKGDSFLNTKLYSKERSPLCAVSCFELNYSIKKRKDVWRLAEERENIPEIKMFEEIERVAESKRFATGLLEATKTDKIPEETQRFELVFHQGGNRKLPYEFLYPRSFLMLLRKVPIVKSGQHPTVNDLEFPFRTVKVEEFPIAYEEIYKELFNFVKNKM